jgi:hypothetical protein
VKEVEEGVCTYQKPGRATRARTVEVQKSKRLAVQPPSVEGVLVSTINHVEMVLLF